MMRPPDRKLTLADLAIFIAASAVAMFVWRFSWETMSLGFGRFGLSIRHKIGVWPAPAVLSLAGSLLIAGLIPPRPRRKIWFRRPGNWAVVSILAFQLVQVLSMSWQEKLHLLPNGPFYHPNLNDYLYASRFAGAWVAVAWVTLALSGAGRPEAGWIDRTGRVLGALVILQWIAARIILF